MRSIELWCAIAHLRIHRTASRAMTDSGLASSSRPGMTRGATIRCAARRAKHPIHGSTPAVENIPLYRNSEISYASRNPAQGRGAYRDRHERGSGGGGRRWHRREELRRAESRERECRAYDRCDRRTAKSCGPGARWLASSLAVMWRPNRARASAIRKDDGGNSATLPEESAT